MTRVSTDIAPDLAAQIERIIRDGWYPDEETVVREALARFVEAKSFLGDSPRMLQRFAADALNDSKPEVALKFADRALSLAASDTMGDFGLYQSIVELRVQILLVLGREAEALTSLRSAREKLPDNPTIVRWIEKLDKQSAGGH